VGVTEKVEICKKCIFNNIVPVKMGAGRGESNGSSIIFLKGSSDIRENPPCYVALCSPL